MDKLNQVFGLIKKLFEKKTWWGKIEVSIEGPGGITNIKVTENIKL